MRARASASQACGVNVVELGGLDERRREWRPVLLCAPIPQIAMTFCREPAPRSARSACVAKAGMVSAIARSSGWHSSPEKVMDGLPGSGRREHETVAGRPDHELRARVVTWPPLRLARLRCERGSVDVVQAAGSQSRVEESLAIIGMDVHRSFAQAAFLQDGQIIREQRVELVLDRTIKFAKSLSIEGEVVIEATGNSAAVERILRPFVKRGDRGEFADGSRDRLRSSEDR